MRSLRLNGPPSALQTPRPSTTKSFGITFFAGPHLLTPIESYSYKKQGGGGVGRLGGGRRLATAFLPATRLRSNPGPTRQPEHREKIQPSRWRTMSHMAAVLRGYEPRDFSALFKLDQSCFAAGISYSKTTLRYFLDLPNADCIVAEDGKRIAGFVLSEENPPLAHIITLDVAESHRRQGLGSAMLCELEKNFARRRIRTVLLETAVDNEGAVAFWKSHGYRVEATLQRYYLGRLAAYEMRKKLASTENERAVDGSV